MALISKLLWPAGRPQGKPRKAFKTSLQPNRGITLRTILDIRDDHLLKDRKLRDHLEHFDERLDEWATSCTSKNFVDYNIGHIGIVAGNSSSSMRNYDHHTGNFSFRNEIYNLPILIQAVKELRPIVIAKREENPVK